MALTWNTEKRRVKDLKPFDKNPRTMTEKQTADLKRSLDMFDLVEIPAINTDNTIIAGHQRIRLLMESGRGDEEIDVRVPSRRLTDIEVREYCIRSNRDRGSWDWDKLANEFDIDNLVDWGFSPKEFDIDLDIAPGDLDSEGEDSAKDKLLTRCPKCGFEYDAKDSRIRTD